MAMGTRKIGPAVAAGCTMVIKPAAQTPLTMLALAADPARGRPARRRAQRRHHLRRRGPVMRAADPRPAAAQALLHRVHRGRRSCCSRSAREQVLRTSMELGGNAPFVVFDDADLDKAVEGAMLAKMRNIGEACTAANRFLVHGSVADEFARRLAERMGAHDRRPRHRGRRRGGPAGRRRRPRQGRPSSSTTRCAQGATVAHRRPAPSTVPATSTRPPCWPACPRRRGSCREEIFGPVAPITRSTTEDEAHRRGQRHRVRPGRLRLHPRPDAGAARVRALETGMVGLNQGIVSNPAAPFGGVKAVRPRPRGRHRGHRRVPRDQVRRHRRLLTAASAEGTTPTMESHERRCA